MKRRISTRKGFVCETNKLFLRSLELEDLNGGYPEWFNDESVCRYNSHGMFPKNREELEAYIISAHKSTNKIVWAIIDTKTDIHIGNISLQSIDWINRSAELAIIIGEKDYWGKGYATDAAMLLLNHGFNKLNLNRIYCGTAAGNIGMQKLALKLKMKREGTRRSALYLSGRYVDLYEYGILRNEFSEPDKQVKEAKR